MSKRMIVGASRGIGLELVKQYAEAGDEVIACVRNTGSADLLNEVAAGKDNITIEELDISDPASIDAAAARIGDIAIDSLIISAGILSSHDTLDEIDLDEWHRALDVHTIGPTLIARAFKRNLLKSGDGKLILMSSQTAASTWPLGGLYMYSSTKAGVAKVCQILAIDWQDDPITITVLHPGWVQTDMGGPQADIPVTESASGIRTLVDRLTKADSGKFLKWNGEIHPW